MNERLKSAGNYNAQANQPKTSTSDLVGPRKTMIILIIVVGCFAVLWPKVFYPMLVGSANQHIKPSPIDKTTGCCDVISDSDVNTIKILSELCSNIIQKTDDKPLTGKEIISRCKTEILKTCGIDISEVLQQQVRLGRTVTQILHEIRSLNGSLCLKYNFGVAPWRLGVPHRVSINFPTINVKQERPMHLRSEIVHPAFRERGRAIPQQSHMSSPSRPPPRIVEGRPGPLPGMRPTIGGAGHVVPASQKGTSSMSVIMPIYTIGIVIFFTYTLMKLIFKKQPEGVGGSLYPPVEPDRAFRQDIFESEKSQMAHKYSRDGVSSKLVVNAMSALLDEVDQEMEYRRKTNEVANQNESFMANGNISNGNAVKPQDTEQTSVKVLGMEMTASCEGGQKWSRPNTPVIPVSPPPTIKPTEPPQSIYLEGALPAQSQLLVADSAIETQLNTQTSATDPPVVLAGKMTLSVISMDSIQDTESTIENKNVASVDLTDNHKPGKKDFDVKDEIDEIEIIENNKTQLKESKNDEEAMKELKYNNISQVRIKEDEKEEIHEDLDVKNNDIIEEIKQSILTENNTIKESATNQVSKDFIENSQKSNELSKPADEEEEEVEEEEEEEEEEEVIEEEEEEEGDEEIIEESKYNTASSLTAAENEISDEENGQDEEESEEEIEIEEIEEDLEVEEELIDDDIEGNIINHLDENK